MLRDAAVDLLMSRLGKWRDTTLKDFLLIIFSVESNKTKPMDA